MPSIPLFPFFHAGYAVSFGHFVGPANDEQGVAGAPRAKEVGKVTIYDINNGTVYQEVYGEPVSAVVLPFDDRDKMKKGK